MKKVLIIIAAIGLVATALFFGGAATIDAVCLDEGPDIAADIDGYRQTYQLYRDGSTWHYGNSWRTERGAIHQMHLEGAPLLLGFSTALLSEEENQHLEDELLGLVDRSLPSPTIFWLIQKYVTYRNCNLASFVPTAQIMEFAGAGAGYQNRHPEMGPPFHRILNYHAAHDISHYVMDTPLMGCTAFAAWDKATTDGHLLVGRNFDFEAGKAFDVDKLVMEVIPENGFRFMSVGWPGLLGVVTGINEKLIYISLNGANSADNRDVGIPVSLLLRQVMEQADSIESAFAIIQKAPVFVSDIFLVADGKTGNTALIEKTPAHCAIIYPQAGSDTIVSSNHFHSTELQNDPRNLSYLESGSSKQREERMLELVARHEGHIDFLTAAEILRDRKGLHDEEIGNGNRYALNALIATHSVITDVTKGIMWVSSSPHQLGPYLPFSLNDFASRPDVATIPEDPFLSDGYSDYLKTAKSIFRQE